MFVYKNLKLLRNDFPVKEMKQDIGNLEGGKKT
jgi:hypothetical protein